MSSAGEALDSAPPLERSAQLLLLGSVFIVASCGLVYQLVAGAISSYLLGDAVTQFSLVIGVFLCAMGVGSYLSRLIRRRLLATFVEIEIWIGLIGGLSSLAMFAVGAFAEDVFTPFFYGLCALIGGLVGIEIPLLVRILQRSVSAIDANADGASEDPADANSGLSKALSEVLALDYIGALAGSLLFPFVVLPWLGLARASVVFGVMNLAIAAIGWTLVRGAKRAMLARLIVAFILLLAALGASGRIVGYFENLLYQDSIVYAEDSPYQRVVLTRWRNDTRLFLNGHLQFSTIDEARYHEALVIPAMEAAALSAPPRQVLILGGGDGLAARRVLQYPSVERIVLVDLDPAVTELATSRPELVALNDNALASPTLQLVHQDAMRFLREDEGFYDVVLIDLPDPSSPTLAKLYSSSFYSLVARRLSSHGVLVTQATSPYFARQAFWCIAATLESAISAQVAAETGGLQTFPYHLHVPSFGEWGFVLASRQTIQPSALALTVPTEVLTRDSLHSLFHFSKDMQRVDVAINQLDDPVLFRYYEKGWGRFNAQ